MAKLNLAIIGVGLIGGSFGLALKSRLGDDVHITGLCRTQASMDAAVARGAVDEASAYIEKVVKDADVIYLSKQRPYARRYLKFLGELYKACKKAGWDTKLMRRIHGGNFVKTMQYNVLDKIVHNHKLSDEDKLHYFNEATKIFLEAIPLFTVHQAVNLSGECPFVGSNMLKMLAKSRNTFFKEEFAYAKETTNAFV